MSRVRLSFPKNIFSEKFLSFIEEQGLIAVTGDDLTRYVKEEVNPDGRLFRPDIFYSCKAVKNNIVLECDNF